MVSRGWSVKEDSDDNLTFIKEFGTYARIPVDEITMVFRDNELVCIKILSELSSTTTLSEYANQIKPVLDLYNFKYLYENQAWDSNSFFVQANTTYDYVDLNNNLCRIIMEKVAYNTSLFNRATIIYLSKDGVEKQSKENSDYLKSDL